MCPQGLTPSEGFGTPNFCWFQIFLIRGSIHQSLSPSQDLPCVCQISLLFLLQRQQMLNLESTPNLAWCHLKILNYMCIDSISKWGCIHKYWGQTLGNISLGDIIQPISDKSSTKNWKKLLYFIHKYENSPIHR
jgi:hypothetical protein